VCSSDLAAFVLALALPRADPDFLAAFSRGLFALADVHGIELVGGDTTAGPLNICITVFGEVAPGQALLRSGARPGDDLWVSGVLGDARLALEVFRGRAHLEAAAFARVRRAMECPQPRVALGRALAGTASSAIDLSDGLLGDLAHVLHRSAVGAVVDLAALPRSPDLAAQPPGVQRECLLAGGDDYELLFTAAADARGQVAEAAARAGTAVTRVGCITRRPGLRVNDADGTELDTGELHAFDHFRS
jgi:thiamine-monophosphate kinase